jgi:hypothetical protein
MGYHLLTRFFQILKDPRITIIVPPVRRIFSEGDYRLKACAEEKILRFETQKDDK